MGSEPEIKLCTKCGVEPAKPRKNGGWRWCKSCAAAYDKAFQSTPEYKVYSKAYKLTPEYKAYSKAYKLTPEYKAYSKAHRLTPEYKAYSKARRLTPEYKAYSKAYRSTPEHKAYAKAFKAEAYEEEFSPLRPAVLVDLEKASSAPAWMPEKYRLSIFEQIQNGTLAPFDPPAKEPELQDTREVRGVPVGWSKDLDRIKALPRRVLNPEDPRAADLWTDFLRNERESCNCDRLWGVRDPKTGQTIPGSGCIQHLNPIQGWALENAMDANGLLASIAVGGGKTGIDILLAMAIPGVKVAVLIVPPGLKAQLLNRDLPQWSIHFKVPNLAGGSSFIPGRPVLHVVSYNEVSSTKQSDIFRKMGPIDLVITDECHSIADRKTARTERFMRIFTTEGNEKTKSASLSGTITKRSIKEYDHLAALALRDQSPLPLHQPTTVEWASLLDASPFVAPTGLFAQLCEPGEAPRSGFRRRLVETLGVVATAESKLGTSLVISERKPSTMPIAISQALEKIEGSKSPERPDGEELIEALQIETTVRQLAAGFYYRWKFVRGETMEQVDRWLRARKAYFQEMRIELQRKSKEHYDSPGLLMKAAIRWHSGYKFTERAADGTFLKRHKIDPHTRRGPMPTWESEKFPEWYEVRKTVKPITDPVWIDDYLVRDAAAWLTENTGIGWYEFSAFGIAAARMAKVKHYGGGKAASADILLERGDRSIVASIKAHGTGKNLQHAFSRNLVMNPPSDGACWEQMMGRTHRTGQPADTVTVELYKHTARWAKAFESAKEKARYIQESTGSAQKLCYADYLF